MRHPVYFFLACILVPAIHVSAQPDTINIHSYIDAIKSAELASGSGNWKIAAGQWENLAALNPTDGELWYKLGETYYAGQQFEKAINAFKKSLATGSPEPFETAYSIAKCYAKKDEPDSVLAWLQRSFDAGYRNIMGCWHDSNFQKYSGNSMFRKIVCLPAGQFKSREEGWRFDLALIAKEIKRRSPNPYRYTSAKTLETAIETLEKKIPSLTDMQVTVELMKIMALVGDGHTMIYAFFERPEFLQNLPLDFYAFEEGLFITAADRRYAQLLGCQLLALDGKSITEILQGMDPIINRDNAMAPKVMGLMRMRTIPLLHALGLVEKPSEVVLTIKDSSSNIKKISVKADCPIPSRKLWDQLPENWTTHSVIEKTALPFYRQQPFVHYWFSWLPEDHTIYFQYNAVANDKSNPFNSFCDSLFSFIEYNDVHKLVIDLRLNNGGNTLLTPYLLDKIIACKKINKPGHLFGIIGRHTYSAAINLLGYMQRFTKIILMGEPTGSCPNFIGEDNPFELPYSKLMANISDLYWQSSWPLDQRKWFAPFMYFPPRFIDYKKGRDPVLEAILKYNDQQE